MLREPAERKFHLLVVDDDREIRDLLRQYLSKHGYRVTLAADAKEARRSLSEWNIDLIVLDLMLPGEDGLTFCREVRAKSDTPILMLTALGEEADKVVGLEMGADDYLTKPFGSRELVARIKTILRRAHCAPALVRPKGEKALQFAEWKLDLARRRLQSPEGLIVELSASEFSLLVAFAERPQHILSRDQLLDLSRGRAATPFDRSIDVQVGRLRRKIEKDPKKPEIIKTVRGGGYVFTPIVEAV